jgi:small redox-active disulfide protein 2
MPSCDGGQTARQLEQTDEGRFIVKKLQVLGPGCANCEELCRRTEEAAKALGLDYELEKVKELQEIMAFGVFTIPALVVDGEVKVAGQLPSVNEIKKMLE